MKLIYSGSVKNLYEDGQNIVFEYTDQFSVFDWGAMPDTIKNKGLALSLTGAGFFKILSQQRIKHHFVKVEGNQLHAKKVSVLPPEPIYEDGRMYLDYSAYENKPVDALVPLEVIFRFGMTQGSSLMKRIGDPDYMNEIGAGDEFKIGSKLEIPLVEFSTKLEESDRYLKYKEAQEIAGLSSDELYELRKLSQSLALFLRDFFGKHQIELLDGKFEFAFCEGKNGQRSFMLVDSIGPDELRLIYKGKQLSKERLREFYRQTSWYEDVETAKKQAEEKGVFEWKQFCKTTPPVCDGEMLSSLSDMYCYFANIVADYLGEDPPFKNIMDLDSIWERL